MTKRKPSRPDAAELRRRAEARAQSEARSSLGLDERERRLLHELEVHRIELELQNEELRASRQRAEQVAARFESLFEYSPLGYVVLGPAGVLRTVNRAAARLLGPLLGPLLEPLLGLALPARGTPLVGQRFAELVSTRDRETFEAFLADAPDQAQEGSAALEVGLSPQHHATGPGPPLTARLTIRSMWAGRELLLSVEDVSERREAEERLREADRRKAEFLVTLSHELRTPLAAILTAAHVAEHRSESETARRAPSIIRRQAEHLARLVDDLLDVSRIERGKLVLKRTWIDLRDVVLRAAEDFRGTLEDHGVGFEVAVPDASVWADADATRVTQVVGNLLGNATKFTRSGDSVLLSLAGMGEQAEIRVKDSGAGIDASLLPHIFGAFVQGDRTAARSGAGLGVGLAVVKALTELHGGSVRAESAGAGKGAEFVVRLPVHAPPFRAQGGPAPAPPG
jgi:signal transduction histidine kinase